MAGARTAAYNFFNTMNISANSHFAFETFSDTAGVSPGGVWTGTGTTNENMDGIDPYAPGGTGTFPLPLITLTQAQSNFTNVVTALEGNNSTTPTPGAVIPCGQTTSRQH